MKFRHPLASLVLLAAPLIAATPAAPPNWAIDKPASQIGFRSSMGGQAFAGRFTRWDARIAFDPAALDRSSVTAVIDTGSATSGDATRDQALPGADWFAVGKFPRATFVARRFQSQGANRYRAEGALTIRNVTRPVSLPFQLTIQGDRARMLGTVTIDRSTFGVGQGQFAAADTIPFGVAVTIRIDATRGP